MNFINLIQYSRDVLQDENYLFKDIVLPIGIDKEILINTIMDTCAVATPLYNYPELLKAKIDNLFKKNYDVYTRLLKAFNAEYNPIDNYNRKTSYTDTTHNIATGKGDAENKVSAYDSSEYQPNEKTISNSNNQQDGSLVHEETTSGNIGVTTTQRMLESELNVRPKLNIYEVIANDFYNELMLYIQ